MTFYTHVAHMNELLDSDQLNQSGCMCNQNVPFTYSNYDEHGTSTRAYESKFMRQCYPWPSSNMTPFIINLWPIVKWLPGYISTCYIFPFPFNATTILCERWLWWEEINHLYYTTTSIMLVIMELNRGIEKKTGLPIEMTATSCCSLNWEWLCYVIGWFNWMLFISDQSKIHHYSIYL